MFKRAAPVVPIRGLRDALAAADRTEPHGGVGYGSQPETRRPSTLQEHFDAYAIKQQEMNFHQAQVDKLAAESATHAEAIMDHLRRVGLLPEGPPS